MNRDQRHRPLLLAALTVFFVVYGALGDGDASFFFALLGALGTWRHDAVGRRRWRQGGLDLIGTEDAASPEAPLARDGTVGTGSTTTNP